jgi:hypothetical protein
VRRAAGRSKLGFEGGDLRAENEPPAGQNAVDCSCDSRVVLTRLKVDERDSPCRHTGSRAVPAGVSR